MGWPLYLWDGYCTYGMATVPMGWLLYLWDGYCTYRMVTVNLYLWDGIKRLHSLYSFQHDAYNTAHIAILD